MKPLRPRYAKIERIVDGVLFASNVDEPQVPVEKIVQNSGVAIKRGNLGEVSGLLVRSSPGAMIGVNGTHPKVRQRFTIAHEYAHFVLHDGIANHFDSDFRINFRSPESSQTTDAEEIEANYFAACLLMPRKFLDRDEAVNCVDDDDGVAALARRYNVSRHAMSLRLGNLYKRHLPF